MTHGRYLVTGSREYRGHKPGATFEAALEPGPERRAIERGAIQLLERVTPSIEPGSYQLPEPWPPEASETQSTGAPQSASRI